MPLQEVLDSTRLKYDSIFQADSSPNDLPFEFKPDNDPVDDSIPKEEEIRYGFFRMQSRKAPGLTMVSVDHLKRWYS